MLFQAAERALYHLLQISKGQQTLSRATSLPGIDADALGNFFSRTLSKLEASDDDDADL
jgi:hypothetical protein